MFKDQFDSISWENARDRIYAATESDLNRALAAEHLEADDLFALLSPAADSRLEELARRSADITRMRFGNTIQLYTPLYISNECSNTCLYCGFNRDNDIKRVTLSPDEVDKEAHIIYEMGFRHILLLTGEHPKAVPVNLLADIGKRIHKKFSSVSIEVYPMKTEEYKLMVNSGIDGLTLYQETYNQEIYDSLHPSGRKKDFFWRLDAPDRGGMAGFRRIGIGSLLGLSDWRVDGFFSALHAIYLTKKYWQTQTLVSFPRLREAPGGFAPLEAVSDRDLTHLLCAMRIILPDAGLVLSTRESAFFRDNVMPLGVTTMSAGSKTEPGGYSGVADADKQFSVEDDRSPEEIAKVIKSKGYYPVWKDWDRDFT
ncbi:MAG: 2-iminoacetate synthase ThiH [bacterium]|nr:2-iminoacetate synthase ThiH [bacterium]